MNKTTVKRLNKIAEDMQRHEEAIERKMNTKTVAIVKFRVGLEDGVPHSILDTATYFDVSDTWVSACTRKVQKLVVELDKQQPKPEPSKVGVMTATIKDGVVEVKHNDPAIGEEIRNTLQGMVDEQTNVRNSKMEIAHEAHVLQGKANTKGFVAFMAMILALVIGLVTAIKTPELTAIQVSLGYLGTAFIAFLGLIQYVLGVSCMSKRNGLLSALRTIDAPRED